VPGGLGVELDGFTLHDLHPPPEVVNSYHAVAKAIQERDRAVNEAAADALQIRRRAEEEAFRLTRRAQADAYARTADARAERDAFLAWNHVRSTLTPAEEAALTAERAKAGQDASAVDRDIAARRAKMLAERRAVIETWLTYRAFVEALQGRDKLFVDGDVAVRPHLLPPLPELRLPGFVAPKEP
jgi:regulator of protease activity HflC (stomatin/prohibitin superfamily)